MTKYLLHGGFTRRENELNKSFFKEFVKDIPDNGDVLLVFFASEPEDVDEKFMILSETLKNYVPSKKLNFVNATREDLEDQLGDADAVFIQGGNTDRILEALEGFDGLKDKLEGKTVAGSSAGAYILATHGAAHTSEKMRNGFGVLPLRLVCHYGSPDLPPTENSVRELEAMDQELELVFLRDCEWKKFLV